MFRFISLGLILLVQFVLTYSSKCDCDCDPPSDPPLKLMFQVVPHFKQLQFCNRICTSNYGVSDNGVRHISIRCKLNKSETASELCECIYDYISQKNWLDGSNASCCDEDDHVILNLEGKPDPTLKGNNATDTTNDQPLQQLRAIIDQFPQAKLENHNCRPTCSQDKCGFIHCKFECDLRPDSPCKEKLCGGILAFVNQDGWMDNTISKCTSTGKLLHLEIIGDSQPGNDYVEKH